jgi:hypothetical protein
MHKFEPAIAHNIGMLKFAYLASIKPDGERIQPTPFLSQRLQPRVGSQPNARDWGRA